MSDKLQRAIKIIKSGDKVTGRQLLLEIIKTEPGNENAWLWMTQVVSSDNDRLKCLQKVLQINPNNKVALKGLATLQEKKTEQPKQVQQKSGRTASPKITRLSTGKDKKTAAVSKSAPQRKKSSRLTFWLMSSLLLVLLCCCGIGILSSVNQPVTNETKTQKTLTVPAGQLSKYVNEYSKYEEVFVYKKDGTLDPRPNDLEELCRDYVFYRRKILEYEAAGQSQKAAEARATFQQVNAWLDEYDRDDFEIMYFDILGLGN